MKTYSLIIFILASVFSAFGQTPASSLPPDDQPIKVNTLLLNIPVIASDREGRNISGLTKDNFSIFEDGEKQPIEFFADAEAPMNVAILIDTSYSTRPFLHSIKSAAHDFIKTLRPEDRAVIASFDFETRIICELSSDTKKLNKAIGKASIAAPFALRQAIFDRRNHIYNSLSNMQDAMYQLVTETLAPVKGRKAILVLTDGLVGGKLISNQKLLYTLSESDVIVYPVLFGNNSFNVRLIQEPRAIKMRDGTVMSAEEVRRTAEEMESKRLGFMNALGNVTGGKAYRNDAQDFKGSFQKIADELKKQYLVGFYPQNMDDGKSHRIIVEVSPKTISIRTKRKIELKPLE